jgi:hypothetical protein
MGRESFAGFLVSTKEGSVMYSQCRRERLKLSCCPFGLGLEQLALSLSPNGSANIAFTIFT